MVRAVRDWAVCAAARDGRSAIDDDGELAARAAAAKSQNVRAFTRKRPVRNPWPDDLERECAVIEAPMTYASCGGARLAKLGEDVTKTLSAPRITVSA